MKMTYGMKMILLCKILPEIPLMGSPEFLMVFKFSKAIKLPGRRVNPRITYSVGQGWRPVTFSTEILPDNTKDSSPWSSSEKHCFLIVSSEALAHGY